MCICDCGNEKVTESWNLQKGYCRSCGCLQKEAMAINKYASITHGQSRTRLYTTWIGMKQRCYYPKHRHFDRYGGRGIRVCDEWVHDFPAFQAWAMANGYTDDLTIDRIDVDGNYEPSNCRWATYKDQANNMSSNRMLELNGVTHTLKEWSVITGISRTTIRNRLDRNWSIEEALTKKPGKNGKKRTS